ncbi:hypothetical protein PVOR_01425 [Paenibacillus vortex V453]|jgi:hypothetical protein|uniref:Uncharacterized protein n=2 Tax=Paenibacillus TaxID=44249 RepID=A0A163IT18_9BACL|nr:MULTISPECIES: hypothetical protein [Paenibacillus]ANA80105.1 hypothetical protein A3958_08975 [Paenibacillus glucanolyticus]AVV55872.1 hypothetical protein C7121_06830 [Paenibacillus glucanolyticus]AWP30402.1 hypothetical protein B9D94_29035 [Paenibacillus sp. Cedars]EFU43832.1 hypothetical protein PVOR_01425 [Paenibacillus vortex V453]ETT38498.1 hypothetical protein C169_12837 [Paenibacillus sp. FSL R5-808]
MINIWFGEIQIGKVSSSSGVFSGSNEQWKFRNTSKQNQAFGSINGEGCSITDILVVLNDDDKVDSSSSSKPTQK